MNQKPTLGVIGLGRMGQAVLDQLGQRDDLSFHPFSRLNEAQIPLLKQCDVVIEFTTAAVAPEVISTCFAHHIPVVSGTTGWQANHLGSIVEMCNSQHGKLLTASNFSIGMNLVFALNEKLAAVLSGYPEFHPSLKEIHHIHKKDMPSGTAFTLLGDIMKHHSKYTGIQLNEAASGDDLRIQVEALREGEVKGYHEVTWSSGAEKITISHEAFDRGIFATGAIVAALWLYRQNEGVYSMQDLISI